MRLLAQHSPHFDPATAWEDVESFQRSESRLFQQWGLIRKSPFTGRVHDFTRLACPDWVNVVAFTPASEGLALLVVEQFRHGVDQATLETIGGVCEPDEAPLAAAQRELREETGCHSDDWIDLGFCHPNPAVQDNRCHFFLAQNCHQVDNLALDPGEELRVWAFSWRAWQAKMKGGEIRHALVMAAFHCLSQWAGWEAFRQQLERGQHVTEVGRH